MKYQYVFWKVTATSLSDPMWGPTPTWDIFCRSTNQMCLEANIQRGVGGDILASVLKGHTATRHVFKWKLHVSLL